MYICFCTKSPQLQESSLFMACLTWHQLFYFLNCTSSMQTSLAHWPTYAINFPIDIPFYVINSLFGSWLYYEGFLMAHHSFTMYHALLC